MQISKRLVVLLAFLRCGAFGQSLTTVSDQLFRADAARCEGTIKITRPAFRGASGELTPKVSRAVRLKDGRFAVQLAPSGDMPGLGAYTADYRLKNCDLAKERWSIPVSEGHSVRIQDVTRR